MTLILVWLTTDKENNEESLNVASDSRMSGGTERWDYAAKIHPIYSTNIYFAYCGSCLPALSAITSTTAAIAFSDNLDQERPLPYNIPPQINAIYNHLSGVIEVFPPNFPDVSLFLAHHNKAAAKNKFSVYQIESSKGLIQKPKALNLKSKSVHCFGSGAEEARTRIQEHEDADTLSDRSILSTLNEVIGGTDDTVGGAMQMVTFTSDGPRPVGFQQADGRKYLFGLPIHFSSRMKQVRWLDQNYDEIHEK